MTWFRWVCVFAPIFCASACGYGPEQGSARLDSIATKPRSHEIAVSLEYARVRDPTGFISRFPNGGIRKLISREARVYLCNLDRGTVELLATVPDFAGIPQPKSVRIDGWRNDELHFSLFGYGGTPWSGDDHADERRFHYRIPAGGGAHKIDALPTILERGSNSGPEKSPPFLSWSRGHLEIKIAIDERISEAGAVARLTFDPESGEPTLFAP